MGVSPQDVKKLREMSGAPMMDCKKALEEVGGDFDQAVVLLRKRGQASAVKKEGRTTSQGLIGTYVHPGAQIAVMVEVNCESDFVARTEEFQELAHDIAMQICAANPRFIRREDVASEVLEGEREILRSQAADSGKPEKVIERIVEGKMDKFFEDNCLYDQHFIKDQAGGSTVSDLITSKITRFGENITIRRFARFKVGEGVTKPAPQ
ncbi:MAG TPA: translation elongation factor Ts [Terriglobia bacterium]|jgi:elongation factor Ts|nr:translation elongation factor Ts [Terriglobia bacterium]